MSTTFPFGKYKGQTLESILATDRDYLLWMVSKGTFGDLGKAAAKLVLGTPEEAKAKLIARAIELFDQKQGHQIVQLTDRELSELLALVDHAGLLNTYHIEGQSASFPTNRENTTFYIVSPAGGKYSRHVVYLQGGENGVPLLAPPTLGAVERMNALSPNWENEHNQRIAEILAVRVENAKRGIK